MTEPRRPRRITYANVVSTLALVAALGTGGAYAANQLGRGTVGPKQLRDNAVGSRAIRNHSIAIDDLARKTQKSLASVYTAKVTSDGHLESGTATSASFLAPDTYKITFSKSVADCTYAATPAAVSLDDPVSPAASARITGQGGGSGGSELSISTFDATGNPVPSGLHVIVAC